LAVATLLLAVPTMARADIIFSNFGPGQTYDVNNGNPIGNGLDGSGNNYAQAVSFIAPANYTVTSVSVALAGFGTSGTNDDPLFGTFNADNGDSPGTVLASTTAPPGILGPLGNNNPLVVVNGASIPIVAGERYWITISDTNGNGSVAWNLNITGDTNDTGTSTDGGMTWFSPSFQTPGAFEVDGTLATTVTPEPGSLALLGTGAMALLGGRRLGRRARRAAEVKNRRPQIEELEDRNLLSAPAVGTWASLTNMAPDFPGTMQLLSNGKVMIQGYSPGNDFMLLSPDSSGSYTNGTFTFTAPMSTPRLYYSSNLLPTGKLFIMGGEYSGNPLVQNSSNTGEIYDPATNTWTPTAPFPLSAYGDEPSMLLPDGHSILLGTGDEFAFNTYIYNTQTNTFSGPFSTANPDSTDEEGYVKLPNNNVLRYNIFTSVLFTPNIGYAEEFNPTTNTWNDISPTNGTANGSIPALSEGNFFELGPLMRLQDGRIFVIGDGASNGATAFYNPATNTWSAGPNIPSINGVQYGDDDGPAAELPNGDIIFTADTGVATGSLSNPPQQLFIFDPTANTITQLNPLPPSPYPEEAPTTPGFVNRMLVLPTGQVLFTDSDTQMWIFTPSQAQPAQALRPVVNSLAFNGTAGSFTLTGRQLNGQSAGSAYGDDVVTDENYPIVRFQNATGQVFYATTTNWSTTGVATGLANPETVNVQLPAGMPAGRYSVIVTGAGLQSNAFAVNISAAQLGAVPAVSFAGTFLSGGSGSAGLVGGSSNSGLAATSLALTHNAVSGTPSFLHQTSQSSSVGDTPSHSSFVVPQAASTSVASYFGLTNREKVIDSLFSTGLDDMF
jgi:hypothetical protein